MTTNPTPIAPTPEANTAPITVDVSIVFFCKDCQHIVKAAKVGNKYVYRCPVCHTKNVAFGTEKSIRKFYRVREDLPPPQPLSAPQPEQVKPTPTVS